jgi:hypothetical protein
VRLAVALLATGCAADAGPPFTASPDHVASFGYVDVTFVGDFSSLGEIGAVTVGDVPTYNLRATPGAITVTVQGAPSPGAATVGIWGASGSAVRHSVFRYDPPVAGVPKRWMAFGASLTQGTESMGIDEHTQTHGVSAAIARAAGVYLALPILDARFFAPLATSDFNADCSQKSGGINLRNALNMLTDPATGFFDARRARLAWQTDPQDIAVGGSKVSDTLDGGGAQAVTFLGHLVNDPTVDGPDLFSMLPVSQIAKLEQVDPEVAFSTDLLANDIDGAVTQSDDLHLEMITPLATLTPPLEEMMMRLGKLHGQYFIANLPSLTFVPNVVSLRAKLVATGGDVAAFDAKKAMIDSATDQYNQALAAAMQPYPNLHLLDLHAEVEMILSTGLRAGGELLTVKKFDGLLSLDNLHFTDTGYAEMANFFLQAMNDALKVSIPMVDLGAVYAQDPLSPPTLRAAGLTCVPPAM